MGQAWLIEGTQWTLGIFRSWCCSRSGAEERAEESDEDTFGIARRAEAQLNRGERPPTGQSEDALWLRLVGAAVEAYRPETIRSLGSLMPLPSKVVQEFRSGISTGHEEAVSGDRSPAISSNCSRAARRSSTISSAIWSGGGRLAVSSMLSSRSQKMSRFTLSRFMRSS